MQFTVLGRTGLKVSVMGLGGGGDSRLGVGRIEEAASVRVVQTALDLGVNFIDTAEAYGTEALIGRALQHVPRDRVVLSTKKTTRQGRLEPEDVVRSLESSLQRLATDHVDVYHLHGVSPDDYPDLRERIVPVLLRLKEQGKVRFLGITERFAEDPAHVLLERALPDKVWDVVMVGFNVLNQSARRNVFPLTLKYDVGTLIMFAVRRAFSRSERLDQLLADLKSRGKVGPDVSSDTLRRELEAGGASSIVDAAYRFCRYEPGAHVVLSGTANEQHLQLNAHSLAQPDISPALRRRWQQVFEQVDDVSGH